MREYSLKFDAQIINNLHNPVTLLAHFIRRHRLILITKGKGKKNKLSGKKMKAHNVRAGACACARIMYVLVCKCTFGGCVLTKKEKKYRETKNKN